MKKIYIIIIVLTIGSCSFYEKPIVVAEKYFIHLNNYEIMQLEEILADKVYLNGKITEKKKLLTIIDSLRNYGIKSENIIYEEKNDSTILVVCNNNGLLDYSFNTVSKTSDKYSLIIKKSKIKSIDYEAISNEDLKESYNQQKKNLINYVENEIGSWSEINIREYLEKYLKLSIEERGNLAIKYMISGNKYEGKLDNIPTTWIFRNNGTVELYMFMMRQATDNWYVSNGKLIIESGAFEFTFNVENNGESIFGSGMFAGRFYKR
jgi:hypothetical protein